MNSAGFWRGRGKYHVPSAEAEGDLRDAQDASDIDGEGRAELEVVCECVVV